ncbi:MAG TPA: DMT family transporter [Acidimicrobiales bacterium]|nr:DMT family transporter [Acidimicrobiales bacterium]
MVYVLAALAAFANAATTILQRLGVETAPPETTMRLSLLAYAVRRKVWLAGFGVLVVAFLLQAFALHFGPITVVQPALTLELPFLVIILWVWFHQRMGWREWVGAFGAAGGLAVFLVAANVGGGSGLPDFSSWTVVTIACLAGVTLTVLFTRFGPPAWKAAMFGSAAAIAFALTAAFIKQMTDQIASVGWGFLADWTPYAVAVTGLFGFFLAQNAFHSGPVTASQATLVVVDPLASVAIGIGLFGDSVATGGVRVPMEILGLVVMFAGVLSLAMSPMVARVKADSDEALWMTRRWREGQGGREDDNGTEAAWGAGCATRWRSIRRRSTHGKRCSNASMTPPGWPASTRTCTSSCACPSASLR